MLIDTHTHTNFDAFKDDYKEVIDRALKENIQLINVGSDFETSKRAVEIAGEYKEGVYAAVGLHPTSSDEDFNESAFLELVQDKKVVGIGETGLDYFRIKNQEARIKGMQKELFLKHIELAQKVNKPLIIHCRDAHDDMLEILERSCVPHLTCDNNISRGARRKLSAGVMHFFTGTLDEAKKYIGLGFYISFSGVVTFSKDYDIIVREIPLDKILIETDAPYAAPAPFRGERNEPSYVKYVAQKIADLRGASLEEIERQTTENAKKLFKI